MSDVIHSLPGERVEGLARIPERGKADRRKLLKVLTGAGMMEDLIPGQTCVRTLPCSGT
jgi:hypothetical protein